MLGNFEEYIDSEIAEFESKYESKLGYMEKLRSQFVKDFSCKRINSMGLDDFVIGKNLHSSFCYRIERELDGIGRILGANALKFGVYWSEEYGKYLFAKKWGKTKEEAFEKIKQAICELIDKDISLNEIKKNPISPMLKWKILFIYHPDKYINIFSHDYLKYFVAKLNILTSSKPDDIEMQSALIEYKESIPQLHLKSTLWFTELLYGFFGGPKDDGLPLLSIAIKNINNSNARTSKGYKPDYEKLLKNRQQVGLRGEKIVLEYERKKLKERGMKSGRVKHISSRDDSKGYDIESIDENGDKIYIEVKSTVYGKSHKKFYLTANERSKSQELPNYYLYRVFYTNSDAPEVEEFKNPNFDEDYNMRPIQFEVSY